MISTDGHEMFHHDIDNLTKMSSDWLLTFNCDKCNVLEIYGNTFEEYDYVKQNHTFRFISKEKDLAIIFNSRLSFDPFCYHNGKVSKANKG